MKIHMNSKLLTVLARLCVFTLLKMEHCISLHFHLIGAFSFCSLFNINEVFAVIEFIQKLLSTSYSHFMKISESDIGVVTPYKMQRRKIAQACLRSGYGDITVGTAEAFQGQEKAVIIVSTVRSGGTRLGFVNNARVSPLNASNKVQTFLVWIHFPTLFYFSELMAYFNYLFVAIQRYDHTS